MMRNKVKLFILKKKFGVRSERAVLLILLGKAEIKFNKRFEEIKKIRTYLCDELGKLEDEKERQNNVNN